MSKSLFKKRLNRATNFTSVSLFTELVIKVNGANAFSKKTFEQSYSPYISITFPELVIKVNRAKAFSKQTNKQQQQQKRLNRAIHLTSISLFLNLSMLASVSFLQSLLTVISYTDARSTAKSTPGTGPW